METWPISRIKDDIPKFKLECGLVIFMAIILGWVIFSFIVAAAAGARGRNGAVWFILALVISPVLALVFVLVIPNLSEERKAIEMAMQARSLPRPPFGDRHDRAPTDHSDGPFEPDGVFAGFPYRVAEDGSILAIMQGTKVKFCDMDRFVAAVSH